MSLASRFLGSAVDHPNPADVDLPLSLEDAFESFRVPRRQWILRVLAARDDGEGLLLTKIARERAGFELNTPAEELNSEDAKHVYVGFYQIHLPSLAEDGLVQFDKEGGRIYANDATHEAVAFLDVAEVMGKER